MCSRTDPAGSVLSVLTECRVRPLSDSTTLVQSLSTTKSAGIASIPTGAYDESLIRIPASYRQAVGSEQGRRPSALGALQRRHGSQQRRSAAQPGVAADLLLAYPRKRADERHDRWASLQDPWFY